MVGYPILTPNLTGNSAAAVNYTFDASAKTVTVQDQGYRRMLFIINTTHGEIIYNPNDSLVAGTAITNGVTLVFDTSAYMQDTDDLLVIFEKVEYPYEHDYIAVTYPTTTSEVYTYKTGGSGGTTVATLTVTYTTTAKDFVSSVERG